MVCTILVVEDEPSIVKLLTVFLEGKGMRVVTTKTGDEAVELLECIKFDLVLLDKNLPGELHGMDLIPIVKQKWPGVPIVMMTGYPTPEAETEAISLGASAFVDKPFNVPELYELLVSLMI